MELEEVNTFCFIFWYRAYRGELTEDDMDFVKGTSKVIGDVPFVNAEGKANLFLLGSKVCSVVFSFQYDCN